MIGEFPPPGTPLFSIGERVPLSFSGPCLQQGFAAAAEVALWSFNDAAFTYGFQVDRSTKEALLSAIHRERARRVEFSEQAQVMVRVAVAPGRDAFEGRLENLSVGGLGVLLSTAADRELKSGYELMLAFELPDSEGTLELLGRTRWRLSVGDQVRYGIQFVQADSAPGLSPQQRIERFVAGWEAGE